MRQLIRPRRGRKRTRLVRKDETREGIVYSILKWPLLCLVFGWIWFLALAYALTRIYVSQYEYWFNWRGKRQKLRERLRSTRSYEAWKEAAKSLDDLYNSDDWKKSDAYAYYDYSLVARVNSDLRRLRKAVQRPESGNPEQKRRDVEDLKFLLESCVKNNFAGIENPRLYSQTYYGTKDRVQEFVEEVEESLKVVLESEELSNSDKRDLFRRLKHNYGKTALCLSGGACLAYYHFGVIKALLDQDLLPNIVTGTSGGALVAALVGTRTNEELRECLIPELAYKITACHENFPQWFRRWWRTGARFDSVDWARRCSWFTYGSLTFREAYERTGRVLNISCIPSDPHSPSLLFNYVTAPDCVIWSAVIASAAVPGILNPVVLMRKTKSGDLVPYSYGHKGKDGSLRTDIPLRALNQQFNVNFSIVSQVNPHVFFFYYSSRGSVGKPVAHRKGRGWRGGFLGSAIEQFLKLDLYKWLKVLRHLELLPRPASQDWSGVWLQKFDGNITIWPKIKWSDLYYILSDPSPRRLQDYLIGGQLVTFPKIKMASNRLRVERLVEMGYKLSRDMAGGVNGWADDSDVEEGKHMEFHTAEEEQGVSARLRRRVRSTDASGEVMLDEDDPEPESPISEEGEEDKGFFSSIFKRDSSSSSLPSRPPTEHRRSSRGSLFQELERQTRVFVDDASDEHGEFSEDHKVEGSEGGSEDGDHLH